MANNDSSDTKKAHAHDYQKEYLAAKKDYIDTRAFKEASAAASATSVAFKLVLRLGASDGYLVHCIGDKEAVFYSLSDTGRLVVTGFARGGGMRKSFPHMLDASKYVYGCMRRTPNAEYALFVTNSNGINWVRGDFTALRAALFSTVSNVDANKVLSNTLTFQGCLAAFNENKVPGGNVMDLFDKMKAKIKEDMPDYEDADDNTKQHVKKPSKPDGIQTASDFLKKYKNRGATVEA